MDKFTGKRISTADHIRQSVTDILKTAINWRCMLRAYGSGLPRRIDAPINSQLYALLRVDIYRALKLWEPRISVSKIVFVREPNSLSELIIKIYIAYKNSIFGKTRRDEIEIKV